MTTNLFSSGGGGVNFENKVGMYYLAELLLKGIPYGIENGILEEVRFQQKWNDHELDDIVLKVMSDDIIKTLSIQIKHDLTFSDAPSNSIFYNVIRECWNTFTADTGNYKFNIGTDRIAIGIGSNAYNTNIKNDLEKVLEWSRTTLHEEAFFKKIALKNFSSIKMREYVLTFRNLINKISEDEISNNDLWMFFRSLTIIHYDLSQENSSLLNSQKNRLLNIMKTRSADNVDKLLNKLISVVPVKGLEWLEDVIIRNSSDFELYIGEYKTRKIEFLLNKIWNENYETLMLDNVKT